VPLARKSATRNNIGARSRGVEEGKGLKTSAYFINKRGKKKSTKGKEGLGHRSV